MSCNSSEANNNQLHYHYSQRKPICFELKAITFAINCSEIHCFIVEKCNEENDGKANIRYNSSQNVSQTDRKFILCDIR